VRPQKTVSFDYTPHKDTLVTQIASNKKVLSQIGPLAIIAIDGAPPDRSSPTRLVFNERFLV
jgi:hypothetical protein